MLCRIFHKNNIGPPSANRYAPFLEEEWDDGKAAIPEEDVGDDVMAGDDACVERNGVEAMPVEQVCMTFFFLSSVFPHFCSTQVMLFSIMMR